MIIEIKGVEFENKGAELMLCAIIERIEQYWPNAQIALTPSKKAPFLSRCSVNAWQKMSVRKLYIDLNELTYFLPNKIKLWLKKWGIVTEADIDMIIDASGFSYSDQWSPAMSIRHLAGEIQRCNKHNKAYIFMPQALGPFTNKSVQNKIKRSFPKAALICAREQDSYQHIKQITGEMDNLVIFPDFTNVVQGKIPSYFDSGKTKVCIIPNKNMINPRNKNKAWIECYIDVLVSAIGIYKEHNLTPFFLNHEGEEDAGIIAQVNQQLSTPIEIVNEPNPIFVKGIISNCAAVFCSRYHGCISALSSNIACVGTSWSHKYEALYQDYQAPELLINGNITEQQLRETIALSLNQQNDLHNRIANNSLRFKQTTERLWQQVIKVCEQYQS